MTDLKTVTYKRKGHYKCALHAIILLMGVVASTTAQKKIPPPSPVQFQNGNLRYHPDALGNRIVDFSFAGYQASAVDIVSPPVKLVLSPGHDDDAGNIQAAIDAVARMPMDKNGFRGTVLLQAGTYHLKGNIRIHASGIVLAGSKETILSGESADRAPLINVKGFNDKQSAPETKIVDAYVAVGTTQITIQDSNGFAVGDEVTIRRPSTQSWIKLLGADHFGGGVTALGWKAGERDIYFERKIKAIDGNRITIDHALTTALDSSFGGAFISKYQWEGRISHCGVENLNLVSAYLESNPKDEDHCWNAINMENMQDGWVRRIRFKHFAGSAVAVQSTARRITIEDCISKEPVSEIGGQRRYSFSTAGQQTLFQRCYAEKGYHDFSVGFCAPGPNAFVQCHASLPQAFSGTIDSWASGVLFDNVTVDGNALRMGDRGQDGNGAGWTAANSVFWQCAAARIDCYAPPGAQNHAFGNWAQFAGNGYWESSNEHITPRSLFYTQLSMRLGKDFTHRALMLPKDSEASSSPSAEVAAMLTSEAQRPPLVLENWIDSLINTPLAYAHEQSVPFVSKPKQQAAPKPLSIQITNGWLNDNGRLITGSRMEVPWWNGGVSPKDLINAKAHITRYVPGRYGKGLTDELQDVVAEMKNTNAAALEHNYGLWYDRRRDDHERIRRMDGEVWPPFYELPFARSGQGLAWDGLSQYDLTRYNKWYWNRLLQFAQLAGTQSLLLIHQHYFQHNIIEAGAHYTDFPWRTANNINHTGFPEPVPYAGDKRIFMDEQFYDINHGARRQLHLAYINKSLDNFNLNTNVIHSLGAEYTGPLHFMNFWLDAIAAWAKKNQRNPMVSLSATKDVQDAVLGNAQRTAQVDIIDIRYWHYQHDGQAYTPQGGQHLAPRQHARLLKPLKSSFEQVYRAVNEYRIAHGKSVLYSGDSYPQFGWAVLLAGGSLPVLPKATDTGFLRAVVNTLPVKGKKMLAGVKDIIIYAEKGHALEVDLTGLKAPCRIQTIDPQTGKVVDILSDIENKTRQINPMIWPAIIWISGK
jgi:Family of unknown function (DUF6298)